MESDDRRSPPFVLLQPGDSPIGGLARAVMEVIWLEPAKDLILEIRDIRTLVQSLDWRKADHAEGGV
jgi:hypothetical protein